MLTIIVIILLVLILFGGYRTYYGNSTNVGAGPVDLLLLVLVILIILALVGYINV